MFADKVEGYLYADLKMTKPFECKHHPGYGIKRDFYCEEGKHEVRHPAPHECELFEIE